MNNVLPLLRRYIKYTKDQVLKSSINYWNTVPVVGIIFIKDFKNSGILDKPGLLLKLYYSEQILVYAVKNLITRWDVVYVPFTQHCTILE